ESSDQTAQSVRQIVRVLLRTYRDLRLWSMRMIRGSPHGGHHRLANVYTNGDGSDELSSYCFDGGSVGRSVHRHCFLVRKQRQLRLLTRCVELRLRWQLRNERRRQERRSGPGYGSEGNEERREKSCACEEVSSNTHEAVIRTDHVRVKDPRDRMVPRVFSLPYP